MLAADREGAWVVRRELGGWRRALDYRLLPVDGRQAAAHTVRLEEVDGQAKLAAASFPVP